MNYMQSNYKSQGNITISTKKVTGAVIVPNGYMKEKANVSFIQVNLLVNLNTAGFIDYK